MLKSSIICTCLVAGLNSHGQVHTWSRLFGDADYDWGRDMAMAPQGHLYIAFETVSALDMDPGSDTAMVEPPFALASYTAEGDLRWAFDLGGTDMGSEVHLAAGPDGSVVLTGYRTTAPGDLDPGPGIADPAALGPGEFLVAKWDALGNFLWAFNIGCTSGGQRMGDVAIDDAGNILITGQTYDDCDLDPGPDTATVITSTIHSSDFCAKYDANGNFLWAIKAAAAHTFNLPVVAADGAGNVYLSGCFGDSIDVDPGPDTHFLHNMPPYQDVYLAKYDPSGALVWAGVIGGGSENRVSNIAANDQGTVALTGNFEQTCDFDPGTGSMAMTAGGNGTDAYIACYTTDGAYHWAKQLGSNVYDDGRDVVVDDAGTVTGTGYFAFAFAVPGGPVYTNGIGDVYAVRYNATGTMQWGIGIGGTDDDEAVSLAVDDGGSTYLFGYMDENADFDPGPGVYSPPAGGEYDVYLARYDGLTTATPELLTDPFRSPWPVPATGHLNIPCAPAADLRWEAYDALGRSFALRGERSGGMMCLDVYDLPPGPYLLRWKEEGEMRSARFVKE